MNSEADEVYKVRHAYHEETDPNWSVWQAFKMWVESIFSLGFWCKFCGTKLEWEETYSVHSPRSYCPACEAE